MAKSQDKDTLARIVAVEVEVELLKKSIRDLAAELAAAAAQVPVPAVVDLSTTNAALKAILERLDQPLAVTKRLRS
jgi:hypothetical protein